MAKLDRLLEQAQEHLDEGEHVLATVQGQYEVRIAGSDSIRSGIFAATSRRLLFYAKKLVGYDLESFPYENISSFEISKGVMGHKMSFFASGNKVSMKWISKGDIPTFTSAVRTRMGKTIVSSTGEPTLPTAAAPADVVSQLERLAKLKEQGVLTDEEFQGQKQKLLDG